MVKFTSPAAARLFLANTPCNGAERLSVAEHGFSLRFTDPAAMLAWCEAAAVNLSPSMPASETGRLLAHLGNAHRVCCNFQEAEVYLRQAVTKSPADPLVLEFYAALKKDRRQLRPASTYLKRAARLRRGAGDNSGFAKTLLDTALVLDESSFPRHAADAALAAIEMIGSMPPSEERERLARAAVQNLATYLVNAGRAQEALWLVSLCKEKLMLGGVVASLRIDWLMADIVGALGEVDSAVATYEEVRRRFAALGHAQEVAVCTLDLARLVMKTKPLQAREEALSVAPILDQLGIPPEARERKLLAEVVEKGSEAALVELAAALQNHSLARRLPRPFPPVPGTL